MSTINLDTFFTGETAQEALDAAAWLGTDVELDPESLWRAERWGTLLRSLQGRPNNAQALLREVERVLLEARVEGTVTVDRTAVHVAGVQITLTQKD